MASTMDAPLVQYVKTSDGYDIAYAVSGSGDPFVFLPGAFEHVQLSWQFPALRPWLEALGTRFQLIQLDERGAGMSSRGLSEDHCMADYLLDIEAVVDRLGPQQFVLFGATTRATSAVEFALKHPGRVSALVLGPMYISEDTFKRSFFSALPAEDWELFLNSLASTYSYLSEPSVTVRLMKQAFDQADFVIRMKAASSGVGERALASLRTPTLVLHPRDFMIISPQDAMRVARLARATLVLIDGSFALGDAEQGVRAIEQFLASRKHGPEAVLPPAELSARELDVLRLIALGKSNPEIAKQLFITRNTVQNHVSSILVKTNLQNRAQAAVYAKEHGLV
jgi:DNA-binding CsgD family transcriptional regulator/pimeloyl-ACP methyl ester carboxylesterase